jgi:putative oxidoreductase
VKRYLGRISPQIYALLRIFAGFMFTCHGAQKLFGVLGGFGGEPNNTAPLFSMMGAAGVIELVGGILILAGFLTPWVAFICSGEMAVAYFTSHFPRSFFPLVNHGELAVVYCWLFLYMASRGAPDWSADSLISRSEAASRRA